MSINAPPDQTATDPVKSAGNARFGFACDPDGATYLRDQYTAYPFHACRVHRYDGDPAGMATVTMQSLSGGIYQGERLHLSLATAPKSKAHVTTQASTIVHSMERGSAEQVTVVEAGAGSLLEYLPNAAILFPQARFTSRIAVSAHPEATVLLSESFLMHDPAGQRRQFDRLIAEITIGSSDGTLRARDRMSVSGRDFGRTTIGEAGQFTGQGVFFAITKSRPGEDLVDAIREALAAFEELYAGASALPNGCGALARIITPNAAVLNDAMVACWQAARLRLTGSRPLHRRK